MGGQSDDTEVLSNQTSNLPSPIVVSLDASGNYRWNINIDTTYTFAQISIDENSNRLVIFYESFEKVTLLSMTDGSSQGEYSVDYSSTSASLDFRHAEFDASSNIYGIVTHTDSSNHWALFNISSSLDSL